MTDEQKPLPKIAIFLFCLFMVSGIYFMLGHSYLSLHEGIWGVLQKLSGFVIFFFFPIGAYLAFQQLRKDNETLWEDFKDLMAVFSFVFIFLMFFKDVTNEICYILFENQKTVISDNYKFYYDLYRGEKIYYLAFDDKSNPKDCNPKYDKCYYAYKVRINGKTYDSFKEFNLASENNPLQLRFKPKAKILMKLEMAKNPN